MQSDLFVISYWDGPTATRERYAEVAEAGFTVAQVDAGTPGETMQVLAWCAEFGLKAIVADARVYAGMTEDPAWEAAVETVVAAYGDHPALWGYFIKDEPHPREFEGLAQIVRAFGERDPEHVAYINLFPNCCSPDQLVTVDYRGHVRAYLDTVRPTLLSYDNYSLMETYDRPDYYTNLEIIRQEALRAGVPFMNIVLATPHWLYRDPTPEDMRWQVYTTLAHGAKALAYWTYQTPDWENSRNGPLTIHGKRTAKWYVIRDLNLELQALAPHLLTLRSTGVWYWPDAPKGTEGETRRLCGEGLVALIEGGQDRVRSIGEPLHTEGSRFLIGEFEDREGLPWVMVVNLDRERPSFVRMTLRTEHRTVSRVMRSTGELRPVSEDRGVGPTRPYRDGVYTSFWLAPGDGRLMRFSG